MIWNYVLRRDLGVWSAPALRWLWFGGHKCAALEGEGPENADYTFFQLFFDVFLEAKVASRSYNNKGPETDTGVFFSKKGVKVKKTRTGLQPQRPTR